MTIRVNILYMTFCIMFYGDGQCCKNMTFVSCDKNGEPRRKEHSAVKVPTLLLAR